MGFPAVLISARSQVPFFFLHFLQVSYLSCLFSHFHFFASFVLHFFVISVFFERSTGSGLAGFRVWYGLAGFFLGFGMVG